MPLRYLQMSQVDNMFPEQPNCAQVTDNNDSDGDFNMERIPFAKNTFRMDIKHQNFMSNDRLTFNVISNQNKENMSSSVNKQDQFDSVDTEIMENNNNRPITPANDPDTGTGQPLTPTANLKVLYNAMSPELRNREEQKRDTSDEDTGDSPGNSQQAGLGEFDSQHSDCQFETIIELVSSQEDTDNSFGPSRKDKSLGLLCQKFLQRYPEYPQPNETHKICLDEVAKELKVERRRIYDIVNVLESVEIVSRLAKNMYAWHGKSNLRTTLTKLKVLGESEGFAEQIQKLKDFEFNRELEVQLGKYAPKSKQPPPDFSKLGERSLLNQAALRKDKSLGIMSQKFLMLFLVSKPKTVNLDLSAKLLIGDANIDKTENAKFKTKIRRLYDIANILTSLDLIRKVHVTEIRGRKPAFKYVGPDIDSHEEINSMLCCSDGIHRPCSRHSMLDCIHNQEVASILKFNNYKPIKPGTSKAAAQSVEDAEDRPFSASIDSSPSKLKFGRHSSFDQICAVAEQERNKLYASASEPASPTHTTKEFKEDLKTKQAVKEGKCRVLIQSEDGNFQILNENGLEEKPADNTNKLPTKGFVRKKSQQKIIISEPKSGILTNGNDKLASVTEAVIIKTSGSKPVKSSGKQPTMIPLTKDQIDAVLRSLKVPVPCSMPVPIPIKKDSRMTYSLEVPVATNSDSFSEGRPKPVQEYYEEVTEDGITRIQVPNMKEVNEKTPVVGSDSSITVKCSVPDIQIPMEKRVRLDFPSPASGDDKSPASSQENVTVLRLKRKNDEVKPSPQRALHLTPEFNMSPSKKIRIEVTPAGDATASSRDMLQGVTVQTIDRSTIQTVQTAMKSVPSITQLTQSPGSKTVAVQLSNQPATIFHVPVVTIQSSQQLSQPVMAVSQQHVQADGKQGPNTIFPCTFSPPLTPNDTPASPKIFSFPNIHQQSSGIALTNVHVVQPSLIKVQSPSAATTLIKPIATKPTLSPNPGSQIVPPQLVTPTSIFSSGVGNKTQGGFVPITSSVSNISKVIITQNTEPTARQIGFDDISACI